MFYNAGTNKTRFLKRGNENVDDKKLHYLRFSRFYWHFWANFIMHLHSMLLVCIRAIKSQGLILNSRRSYATLGTKIPVFIANLGSLLGTKWQKWWIYINISRIVKIVHSEVVFLFSESISWGFISKKFVTLR